MNKVFLIGNLTRDPELTTTTSGISVCKMSIAVGRRYTSADGTRETDFFNITAWRGIAENCSKFLSKGSKIAVCGNIQNRSYEDKDGVKKYITDIVADEVEFLSSKNADGNNYKEPQEVSDLKPIDDDTLPF